VHCTTTINQLLIPARWRQATSPLPEVSGVEDLPALFHVDRLIWESQDLTLLNVLNRVEEIGWNESLFAQLSRANAISVRFARMVNHLQPTRARIVLCR
jgi:hypothetical protein